MTGRAAVALVVLAAAAIVTLGVYSYRTVDRELTDAATARNAAIARLSATTVAEKLDRLVDIGVSLADRVRFRALVEEGRWREAVQILVRVRSEFPFIERIFLADAGGTLQADLPEVPEVHGRNFSERDWYQGMSSGWKPYVSAVYQRAATPRLNVFAVAVPIRDSQNRVSGGIVLQVQLESLLEWVRNVDLGPDGFLYIVDRTGTVAFHPRLPAQGNRVDYSGRPIVREALAGKRGTLVLGDTASEARRLVAYEPVPKYGWAVVAEQPAQGAFAARDRQLAILASAYAVVALLCVSIALLAARIIAQRGQARTERAQRAELERARDVLARQAERLRILHEIDRKLIEQESSEAIAAAVLPPLRELMGVPRAIVNLFDLAAGEAEWLAAAGRRRTHVGSGVRFPMHLLGDVESLKRGETQVIRTRDLPPSAHKEGLLASGVDFYMIIPMIAGGELIGGLSFGGAEPVFPEEQVEIAREAAAQLAIAIVQARLFERVKRHADELELRVSERTTELQAANHALEGFSYSVSHDLRAPVRAVSGFAVMLEEDYGARLDDEGRRLLRVVRESAGRMGQLIDDLLRFSRLGRQPIDAARVEMRLLAREVADELAPEHPSARIDLGELPDAIGDRMLLRQVWANLIGNALKYSAKSESPRVEIGGRAENSEIVYWVGDNGAGFDMRYAEKLFRVFQRLHREEEFAGTGVGLAIVERVITRHGGRVWAEAEVGRGARFFFSLPQKEGLGPAVAARP